MSKLIGNDGENQAKKYLKKIGYKIVRQNFFSRFGEIDIIATDKNCTVFVEVKKRKSDLFDGGAAYVDKRKQRKIIKTAESYVIKNKLDGEMRFDVIEINGDEINHIKNAFFS